MTRKVVLNKSVFSKDEKRLKSLNEISSIHTTLSPGLLMSSTGCDLENAFYILLLLFEEHLAEGYFLIYPHTDPDYAIQRRHFSTGLPATPFSYQDDDGEKVVNAPDEFFYSFEFDLVQENIEFVTNTNGGT